MSTTVMLEVYIVVSHPAGPGLIPSRVSFPGWGFSSTVRQMTGKLQRHRSPYSIFEVLGRVNIRCHWRP